MVVQRSGLASVRTVPARHAAAGLLVLVLVVGLGGCARSTDGTGGAFDGYLTRTERTSDPAGRGGLVGSEVWIGANGGGLRRSASGVEALALAPYIGSGEVSPSYEQVLALPRDPVELAARVRDWASTPTNEENGAVPAGEALEQRQFRMLGALAIDWPLPADLAHAVGEALRRAPLVETSLGMRDPDGRAALRLRRPLDALTAPNVPDAGVPEPGNIHVPSALRRDIYLDPTTLELLAFDDTVVVASTRFTFLRPGVVQGEGIFGTTTAVAALRAGLPETQVAVVAGPWQGTGRQVSCTDEDHRACDILAGAAAALSADEACPQDPELRRWDAAAVGVIAGNPVRFRWCGGEHAKPLLLAMGPDTTFTAKLAPIPGKTVAECTRTALRVLGSLPESRYRVELRARCAFGADGNWYHARIEATHGAGAIVSCWTTARDADGAVLFSGRLGFGFAGMFGNLAVDPSRPEEFDWYAQVATDNPGDASVPMRTMVASYETECVANPAPPI